jgi:hypothetical protein
MSGKILFIMTTDQNNDKVRNRKFSKTDKRRAQTEIENLSINLRFKFGISCCHLQHHSSEKILYRTEYP